jgi:alpha-glucosidase (family GH31 glycosyl hydrolase)
LAGRPIHRRDLLRALAAGTAIPAKAQSIGIAVAQVTRRTIRITVKAGGAAIPQNSALLPAALNTAAEPVFDLERARRIVKGDFRVTIEPERLRLRIDHSGRTVQQLGLDLAAGTLTFSTADGPILGLGEGGPQFDKRGSLDEMKNGQSGYHQRTFGARVPIPLVIGSGGWAMFIHQPAGKFDFTNPPQARFLPAAGPATTPLDLFLIAAREPSGILEEYCRLTGFPDMPPLWSLGYLQSHRTLAGKEEVLEIARTFRAKQLPCDALIYLGTGFCPSGWNTGHNSFAFNPQVFADPAAIIGELHRQHFRVVLHTVFREPSLEGTVQDACAVPNPRQAGCYWRMHREVFATGVDGWWPDEGDQLDAASRLCRDRLYYDGPLADRPNVRPFALHRNAYAGTQRYGAFVWSGDVSSTWETLRIHVPVAINTGLSGLPFWGTDIGGFVPTKELTGELYVRWFQFGAFCPLFRSHGRTWKLRLPWQWNTGDMGPSELTGSGSANPDPSELHNAAVEPVCRRYLNLRYRLMPYLYSAVRECHETGMPIMRALWLHYADDPTAVLRGDEYLWGRDILVAPVVERGAAERKLYLPRGLWYDFWTESATQGGHEMTRSVDLETIPLFVRAGAILPFAPLRQYTSEAVDGPTQLAIYPGADGRFILYDDDGVSYDFRGGKFTKLRCEWHDRTRELRLTPETGTKAPGHQEFEIRLAPQKQVRRVVFEGTPLSLHL